MVIIYVLLVIIGVSLIFFNIPFSKTKTEFRRSTKELIENVEKETDIFSEENIVNLPKAVQMYFRYTGYIGTPKMSYIKASYENVIFRMGKNKPTLKIDYTQFNFVKELSRLAYIDSSLFGVPFEGLDSYKDGKGSMKGIIGKLYTMFDERGESMDKANLATFLSEALFIPNIALQDYVTWEAIDDLHARATITNRGISASGVFSFNDLGEMVSFTTNDRQATATDGAVETVRWTAKCSDYIENNGIKQPSKFQAIWNYEEGDYIYFDANNINLEIYQ